MSGTMRQKLLMALAAALLATVSIRAGAASLSGLTPARVLAGPCAPGGAYDPACDVDHDGAARHRHRLRRLREGARDARDHIDRAGREIGAGECDLTLRRRRVQDRVEHYEHSPVER